MNPFLLAAVDTHNPTYLAGVVIGICLGLGALIFSVIAVVMALVRRTTGWIAGGVFGGLFLLGFGVLFGIGVVEGFNRARAARSNGQSGDVQTAPAGDAAPNIQGRDIAYHLTLPPDWRAQRNKDDFDLLASRRSLYFGVIAEEGSLGTSQTILDIAQKKLRTISTNLVLSDAATVKIDGHDWLQFTARCQVEKIPITYLYSVYAGPEGTYQLVGWTLQNLFDRDAGTLRNLAAAFRFPTADSTPAPDVPASATAQSTPSPQKVEGKTLPYQLTVPADWNVKYNEGAFDSLASHRSIYVGVVTGEGSLGTEENVVSLVKSGLQKVATNLEAAPAYGVKIDGREWLQFVVKCQIKNIPFTYHYYVYSGQEGSFRVVGWTLQNLYDRDGDTIRDVAMTFRFPPASSTPSAVPEIAAPTAPETASSPTPTATAPPAKAPTPARSKRR